MKNIEIVFFSLHDLEQFIGHIVDDNDEVGIIKVAFQVVKGLNAMVQTITYIAYNKWNFYRKARVTWVCRDQRKG